MAANWQSNITQFLACELTGTKVKKKCCYIRMSPFLLFSIKKKKKQKTALHKPLQSIQNTPSKTQ